MAKSKRKPSSSQRSRENIDAAKRLKAMGVLSKQTKMHGGKYISPAVLRKVREHEWILKNNYRALPVSKSFAEEAMRQGMVTLRAGGRNLAVVPNSPAEVKRVHKGIVSGVVPIPGGQMYAVQLPYNSMLDFMGAVDRGELDNLKEPKEEFGFTIFGNMSREKGEPGETRKQRANRQFRTFRNTADLRAHMRTYKFMENLDLDTDDMQSLWQNFHLYRVMPGKWNPADFDEHERKRRGSKLEKQKAFDEYHTKKRSRRVADMTVKRAEQIRERDRERKRGERASLKENDPAEYLRVMEKNRERARKSNAARKAKKST